MPSETIHLDGHIIDSLILSKTLDIILRDGGQYKIARFQMGETRTDMSHAEIIVSADDDETLTQILHILQQHGAARKTHVVQTETATLDGVFPDNFYVTTNLETAISIDGVWLVVQNLEMDCGIVLEKQENQPVAQCVPMHHIRAGQEVVVGDDGVRVTPLDRPAQTDAFAFMSSEVSTERSKERIIEATAKAMQTAHENGQKILFVGGPAILHTGAYRSLEAMIRAGWIDVLFAGNALATHDIERALYGTSLGVELATGTAAAHGHEHHLRAINTIRRVGGIRQAVETGILTSGIMHACIVTEIPYLLAGSIRDDGPLPDVVTDSVKAQDRMRELVRGVGVSLMVATTLHSVATGNLLPACVRTICVDSDADTVIKLMDRGTHQAFGLVTDCEFFLKELGSRLPGVEL